MFYFLSNIFVDFVSFPFFFNVFAEICIHTPTNKNIIIIGILETVHSNASVKLTATGPAR